MARTAFYEEHEGLNFSLLKHIHDSPRHLVRRAAHERSGNAEYAGRNVFRAIHTLALEGREKYEDEYMVFEGRRDKRTGAYQRALLEAEETGKAILTVKEADEVEQSAAAVAENKALSELLRPTPDKRVSFEYDVFWTESVEMPDGSIVEVPCKGLLDALVIALKPIDTPWFSMDALEARIVDLKNVPTTNGQQLMRHVEKSHYHVQSAHYRAGVMDNIPWLKSVHGNLIALGPKPVRSCALVLMHEERTLFSGESRRQEWLQRYIACSKADTWPDRYETEVELDLPHYARTDIDDDFSDFEL